MNNSTNMLIGSWRLTSFTIEKAGETKPWRAYTHGILIYTSDGWMSVAINADDPAYQGFDNVLFYTGRYSVDGDHILHDVTEATDTTRIGQRLVRQFVLTGDVLQITGIGEHWTARLTWKRQQAGKANEQ